MVWIAIKLTSYKCAETAELHSSEDPLRMICLENTWMRRDVITQGWMLCLHESAVTVRSHRERQSGRKSFIFNDSPRRAARRVLGRWERRGELKSGQLYGNELWRGWASTNQNAEENAALLAKHATIIVKFPSINFFHEVNLYSTCGRSAQDQRACLLCGSFKYMTSNRSTSQRQSIHESFYSVAGRAARATFDALAGGGVNAQQPFLPSVKRRT